MDPAHQKAAGKHPREPSWQTTAAMTPAQIDELWTGWKSNSNVGILTGRPSGMFVVDVDPDNGGMESMRRLIADNGPMPKGVFTQKTGSGGYHLLFQMPADFDVTNSPRELKEAYPGIDLRGTGGQIVAAPSVSGKGPYSWMTDLSAKPGPAPKWLLDLLRPKAVSPTAQVVEPSTSSTIRDTSDPEVQRVEAYAQNVVAAELGRLDKMRDLAVGPEGTYRGEPWDAGVFHVACALLEVANAPWNSYSVEQAHTDLLRKAPKDEGFPATRVAMKWESALSRVGLGARPYPQAKPNVASDWLDDMAEQGLPMDPLLFGGGVMAPEGALLVGDDEDAAPVDLPPRDRNDIGNGMRMADHYGRVLRWVIEAQKWALYTGGRWLLVDETIVRTMVHTMMQELIPATEALHYSTDPVGEAPDDGDDDDRSSEREKFLKFLASQKFTTKMNNCLKEAKARPELIASQEDFDSHDMLLNCANGVVDLRTGDLLPHDPDLMLGKQVPVDYDPSAAAPLWNRFLERVQPNQEKLAFLQRCLGYSISGSTQEQVFFVWHGESGTGKSVAAGTISTILGSYGGIVATSVLMETGEEQHPTGWADLDGSRWLTATETRKGGRLEEEKIKEFTGGQKIKARFMNRDFFEYKPVGKIQLITNHYPVLSAHDSIWRRTWLLLWNEKIRGEEVDLKLQEKMEATELPGILAWLVRGCVAWQEQGLNPPQAAKDDLDQWRGNSDPFQDFIREQTMPSPGAKTSVQTLFDAYSAWAFKSNLKAMTLPSFVATMMERQYEYVREGAGSYFLGVVPISQTAPIVATAPWDT